MSDTHAQPRDEAGDAEVPESFDSVVSSEAAIYWVAWAFAFVGAAWVLALFVTMFESADGVSFSDRFYLSITALGEDVILYFALSLFAARLTKLTRAGFLSTRNLLTAVGLLTALVTVLQFVNLGLSFTLDSRANPAVAEFFIHVAWVLLGAALTLWAVAELQKELAKEPSR